MCVCVYIYIYYIFIIIIIIIIISILIIIIIIIIIMGYCNQCDHLGESEKREWMEKMNENDDTDLDLVYTVVGQTQFGAIAHQINNPENAVPVSKWSMWI